MAECLQPKLHYGDIVVMDNLRSHKVVDINKTIEGAEAQIKYLPPYGSDRNPIKQVFANLKAPRRAARARGVEALLCAIGSLMDKSTPDKCECYINMLAVASQGDSALRTGIG